MNNLLNAILINLSQQTLKLLVNYPSRKYMGVTILWDNFTRKSFRPNWQPI